MHIFSYLLSRCDRVFFPLTAGIRAGIFFHSQNVAFKAPRYKNEDIRLTFDLIYLAE